MMSARVVSRVFACICLISCSAMAAPVEPLFAYKPVERPVTGIEISPDGASVAVSYDNNSLHLMDFRTGKPIAKFEVSGAPNTLKFTPNGKILLAIVNSGVASIDVANKQIKHLFKSEAAGGVSCLDISPDGKFFACVGRSSLAIWNIETGVNLATIDAHSGNAVNSVAYSNDGSLIVTGGNDRKITTWSTTTNQEQKSYDLGSKVLSVAFAPDGNSVIAGCDDQTFHRVNLSDGDDAKLGSAIAPFRSFVTSRNGSLAFIAGVGAQPGVLLIDKKRMTTAKFAGHGAKIGAIAVSNDGRFFASGDQAGQINVYPVMEAAK